MAARKKLEVVQADGEEAVTAKVLAQSIRDISVAAKALTAAGLKRRTLLVLLSDASGVPKKTCDLVLDAQVELAAIYLEKR